MFSELPKLFDRNFVIAYFLPVSILIAISAWLWGYWPRVQAVLAGTAEIDAALVAFNATLVIFAAWILSILLMGLNGEIYRLLEGYGTYNPLRIFEKKAKNNFCAKRARLKVLDSEYPKPEFTNEQDEERTKLMEELAQYYPDDKEFVLPTTFGNTLRAFEVYPRVMYGMEGIDGWPRILSVVPKEYRELIDDAKSQVDWWINLAVVSFLFLIELWVFIFSNWGLSPGWLRTILNLLIPLGIFSLLNWFFLRRATSSAIEWGDHVKSAFDIYRFKLLILLGVNIPVNREEEKDIWQKYSQAIIYRLPYMLPSLRKDAHKSPTEQEK